jgi:diguanylate cyclase (GGDEF)-like protein
MEPTEKGLLEFFQSTSALQQADSSMLQPEHSITRLLEELTRISEVEAALFFLWDERTERFQPFAFPLSWSLTELSQTVQESIMRQITAGVTVAVESNLLAQLYPEKSSENQHLIALPVEVRRRPLGLVLLATSGNLENILMQASQWLVDFWVLQYENEQLQRENQHRLEQMRMLIDVSRLINSSFNLQESFRSIAYAAKQLLGLEKLAILVWRNGSLSALFKQGVTAQIVEAMLRLLTPQQDALRTARKPFRLGDILVEKPGEMNHWTFLPMQYREKNKGFLAFSLAAEQRMLPEELLVAQSFANQAALTLENTYLFHQYEQRAKEFSSLFEIAQTITGSLDIAAIVSQILESAQQLVKADEGFIFEREEGSQVLHCLAATGSYVETIRQMTLTVGEGITGWVAKTGVGENVAQAQLDPRSKHISDTPIEPESMLSVPLKVKDRVIGVMTLSRLGNRPFSEEDFRLISIFSTFAASALANARLYENAAKMAITDYLTGLYNYRYFFRRLKEELARTHRQEENLCIILIDWDQFKRYNDRYGHQAGDRILVKFAGLVRKALRISDIAFRYGGDEFVVILPSTDEAEARQVVARLEHLFQSELPQNLEIPLRASFGLAVFPTDANDLEALVKVADERMYAMKQSRGNANTH